MPRRLILWSSLLLFSPAAALAHAVLVHSTPASGATVDGPSTHLDLEFNSRIDIKRSQLTLERGGESTTLHVALGAKPSEMIADAHDLGIGEYTVHWQVLALDGHITRGSFPIKVK